MTALLATRAFAQQAPSALPGFELERLELNPDAEGSLLLGTGQLLPAGETRVSVLAHYEKNPLVYFRDGVRYGTVVRDRMTAEATAAYSLTSWLELGLQVPFVVSQTGTDLSSYGVAPPARAGLDTPIASARVGLLSQRSGGPMDLALELGVGLPLGSAAVLGQETGAGRYTPRLMIGKDAGAIRLGFEIGPVFRRSVVLTSQAQTPKDEVGRLLSGGVSLATMGDGIRGELDVFGDYSLSRDPSAVEAMLGVRVPVAASVELFAAAGMGFGSAPGTPLFRGLAGVAFGSVHPPPKKAVATAGCEPGKPHAPADCPLLDDDGDGVLNGDDHCPNDPGPASNHGCPLPDRDKDGVPDFQDRCPDAPGPASNQGCPEKPKPPPPVKDTDGDGIPDDRDKCPTLAGPAETGGCPTTDTDKDGVPDYKDNCPNEPGPASNQGCPKAEKQMVEIAREKLVIHDKLYFDFDKTTLQTRSYPLLDQVVNVLKTHPEIPVVHIEGHTDNIGDRAYNQRLSQGRAEAVRQYLIEHGVAADRLVARGYGMDRPIDTNDTPRGRENNRRVEFIISMEKGDQDANPDQTQQPEQKPGQTEGHP